MIRCLLVMAELRWKAARSRAPANAAGSQRKRTIAPSRSDRPADGISAAATKGLRQVLLAARGPVQPSACAGYNVSRPVGRVHSRHYFGLETPDVASWHIAALFLEFGPWRSAKSQ